MPVTPTDVLRFGARALHLGAVCVWLGSGLLYLLTRPTLIKVATTEAKRSYSRVMGVLAGRSFALSVASGAYLLFDRLANPKIGLLYMVALAAKLAVVSGIVWSVRMSRGRGQASAEGMLRLKRFDQGWLALALGTLALVLGVVLTLIYEAEIRNF